MSAFDVEVFYDGECPLCMREIRVLRRLDRQRRILFNDIAAGDFDASAVGVTWEALMDRIHGRLPDGTLIEGVEVFRRLYTAVGFSRLVALTRLPGISHLLILSYRLFAKNRLRLTGRCTHGACELARAPRAPRAHGRPAEPGSAIVPVDATVRRGFSRMKAMSTSTSTRRPAWKAHAMIAALATVVGCATSTTDRLRLPALGTVAHVDLGRYVGTWYEIANFPQSFQRDCTATTATYTIRRDGDIDVLNRCRKGSPDGEEKSALGRARVVDRSTNAKLEVSFFRPFWGDYWIIDLADDYSYAVVGHPGRDYLWILSRTPTMTGATYTNILTRLRSQGYETARLVRTLQAPALPVVQRS